MPNSVYGAGESPKGESAQSNFVSAERVFPRRLLHLGLVRPTVTTIYLPVRVQSKFRPAVDHQD